MLIAWTRFHKNMACRGLALGLLGLMIVPFATAASAPPEGKDNRAEEEAKRKAEEEARRKAEEEAKRKAEEEAKRKAEEEAKRKKEEDAKAGRPPGECTQQQWKDLDVAAGRACRGPDSQRSCDGVDDCQILARNVSRFGRCIAARKEVMDRCFRGGDDAHKAELAKEEAGRQKCLNAMRGCKIEVCPQ